MLAAGPRLLDGSNRLDVELHDRTRSLGLDVVAYVLQTFWLPGLRDFYSQHGVRNFESVMLEISPVRRRVVRREPSVATIAADLVRDLIYSIRK